MTDAARLLDEPAHRLIYLCEKGAVVPDVDAGGGRGSSRRFSARNLLELAVALRVRDAFLPVEVAGAVVHLLRAFEREAAKAQKGFALPHGLLNSGAPQLVVVIRDGTQLYCELRPNRGDSKVYGPVDLAGLGGTSGRRRTVLRKLGGRGHEAAGGLVRVEVDVTGVATQLNLDPGSG